MMKEFKVLVWFDVRTNDSNDGFGDYQNLKLVWNGMQVSGVSESDVRSHDKDLNFGQDYELQEVK